MNLQNFRYFFLAFSLTFCNSCQASFLQKLVKIGFITSTSLSLHHFSKAQEASCESDNVKKQKNFHYGNVLKSIKQQLIAEKNDEAEHISSIHRKTTLPASIVDYAIGFPVLTPSLEIMSWYASSPMLASKEKAIKILEEEEKKLNNMVLNNASPLFYFHTRNLYDITLGKALFFKSIAKYDHEHIIASSDQFMERRSATPLRGWIPMDCYIYNVYTGEKIRKITTEEYNKIKSKNHPAEYPTLGNYLLFPNRWEKYYGFSLSLVDRDTGKRVRKLIDANKVYQGWFGPYETESHSPSSKAMLSLNEDGSDFLIKRCTAPSPRKKCCFKIFDASSETFKFTFADLSSLWIQTVFKHNKDTFISLGRSYQSAIVKIWKIGEKYPIDTIKVDVDITDMINWDDRHVISGHSDGTIRVWDIQERKCVYKFLRSGFPISSLTKLDHDTLAVSSELHHVRRTAHRGAKIREVVQKDISIFKTLNALLN